MAGQKGEHVPLRGRQSVILAEIPFCLSIKQAIEDGMALATILSESNDIDILTSLRAYEKLRRQRVADIQLGARLNGLRVDSMSGYTDLKKRDQELAAHADFRAHLYAYDVVPFAKAALEAA
jgi:salicylate hydroxylase